MPPAGMHAYKLDKPEYSVLRLIQNVYFIETQETLHDSRIMTILESQKQHGNQQVVSNINVTHSLG